MNWKKKPLLETTMFITFSGSMLIFDGVSLWSVFFGSKTRQKISGENQFFLHRYLDVPLEVRING